MKFLKAVTISLLAVTLTACTVTLEPPRTFRLGAAEGAVAGADAGAAPEPSEAETYLNGDRDDEVDAAQIAMHEYTFGPEEPLTERDKSITRQAWRAALEAARKARGGQHV